MKRRKERITCAFSPVYYCHHDHLAYSSKEPHEVGGDPPHFTDEETEAHGGAELSPGGLSLTPPHRGGSREGSGRSEDGQGAMHVPD